MPQLIIVGLLVLSSTGCSSIPFQRVSYIPVDAIEPAAVRREFAQSLPPQFQLVNTIVFQYGRYAISVIGYSAVDTRQKVFTVAGLNPLGVKLFELSGDANDVECRFAIEEFTRRGNFARAVADDIRRIYFDRVPGPEAKVYKEKYKIIFRQATAAGVMEYVFAGIDNALIEKRYYKGSCRVWTVSYYEYRREKEKLYPAGIILTHHEHQYQLVVRLKEIRS
ncbi:MAG: DUF3261 domain-containing protein [Desulfobacterales bacterium]|nr:DUF3261 domain-containing protein [Desulfobacterales bacterium]